MTFRLNEILEASPDLARLTMRMYPGLLLERTFLPYVYRVARLPD